MELNREIEGIMKEKVRRAAKMEKMEMERSGLLEKLRQAEAAHKSDVAALKKEVEDVKGQKDR